jgi:hypothetical protein
MKSAIFFLILLGSLAFSACPAGASDCFSCGGIPCTNDCQGAWDENAQMYVSCQCPQGEPCTCHCPYGGGDAVTGGNDDALASAAECQNIDSCTSCAEMKQVEGTVAVKRGGRWCLAYAGLIVGPEDKIWTLNSSKASLRYYDGTKQDVNEESSFTIKQSSTTLPGATGALVLQGIDGAYHFLVDEKRVEKYELRLDNAVLGIEGTEFLVDGSGSGITVSVLEGAVNLSDSKYGKSVLLEKGQRSTVTAAGGPSSPEPFESYGQWWPEDSACCGSAALILLIGLGMIKRKN